ATTRSRTGHGRICTATVVPAFATTADMTVVSAQEHGPALPANTPLAPNTRYATCATRSQTEPRHANTLGNPSRRLFGAAATPAPSPCDLRRSALQHRR